MLTVLGTSINSTASYAASVANSAIEFRRSREFIGICPLAVDIGIAGSKRCVRLKGHTGKCNLYMHGE